MFSEWITNGKGNRVLVDEGVHLATVFCNDDDAWGAIIHGRLLAGIADRAEEMMARVEEVMRFPETARYIAGRDVWQQSKKGGYYKRTKQGVVSVKRAKSGSWYVTTQDGILPSQADPRWFNTVEEAKEYAASSSGLCESQRR